MVGTSLQTDYNSWGELGKKAERKGGRGAGQSQYARAKWAEWPVYVTHASITLSNRWIQVTGGDKLMVG